MILKVIAILSFCLIIQSCKGKPTQLDNGVAIWTKVESGATSWLRDVDFVDERNGWVVGDSGVILNSKSGGESWQRQTCPIEDLLCAVDFVDKNNGWICSRNAILKTNDGGKSWTVKYSEDLGEGRFRDIQFLDENIGFVVGGKGSFGSIGVLLKTADGGETWREITPEGVSTLTHISIVNEENTWVCGFGGAIFSTADVGSTWTKKSLAISPLPSLTGVQFIDDSHGWIGSRDDWLGFFVTSDGGENWLRISEDAFSIIGGVQSFIFVDKNIGWLCSFPFDRILTTTDGGLAWRYDSEIRERIFSFHFLGNETGWAVGEHGSILKYGHIETDVHRTNVSEISRMDQ